MDRLEEWAAVEELDDVSSDKADTVTLTHGDNCVTYLWWAGTWYRMDLPTLVTIGDEDAVIVDAKRQFGRT